MRSPILDWLYPPACALCRIPLRGGRNLCDPCGESLPRVRPNSCRTCGQHFEGPIAPPDQCPNCITLKPAFDFATAALRSSTDALDLVHQFKLAGRPELGTDLAGLCAETLRRDDRFRQLLDPVLIPVPLHCSRLRSRGYNQALEIALPLAQELGFPCQTALTRVLATDRQATLTRKQRLANLKQAFRLATAAESLTGRDLILIDDVFTTGSTAHACARVLRTAKPRAIVVLSVLRA